MTSLYLVHSITGLQSNLYTLTVLKISSKSWLLKSWHICWTNLIWNEKSVIFISNCSNLDSHHEGIKLMPFLSMNLSTFASQSSLLVNELQYSSQNWSWNTCVIFPFPNVDLGITVVSVLQNTRGSTLGKERGTLEWEQRCEAWMYKISQKFKKTGFVSMICDEYCCQ